MLRASAVLVCTEERGKEREETREGTAPAVISSERRDSEGGGEERKGGKNRSKGRKEGDKHWWCIHKLGREQCCFTFNVQTSSLVLV